MKKDTYALVKDVRISKKCVIAARVITQDSDKVKSVLQKLKEEYKEDSKKVNDIEYILGKTELLSENYYITFHVF